MKRSMAFLAILAFAIAAPVDAQQPQSPPHGPPGERPPHGPAHDPMMRHLFPPEQVMQHQSAIGLTDAQRTTLSTAVQQTQAKVVDAQWKLSAEGEKLARLLEGASVNETQVLEQIDRILSLEREVKRAHMGLMVKIKNTLTPAQQDKLRELRPRPQDEQP
jgi:Spy/CpxP family protein refolding chaperone